MQKSNAFLQVLAAEITRKNCMHNTQRRFLGARKGLAAMLVLLIFGAGMQGAQAWQVERYLMCKQVMDSLPVGVTTTFTTDDELAIFWANLTDVPAGLRFRWEWYFPNGSLYGTFDIEADQPWDWTPVFGFMNIRGYPPANILGTWTVKFYVERVLQATVPFEITAARPTVTVTSTELITRTSTMTLPIISISSAIQTSIIRVSVTTEIIQTDVLTLGAAVAAALIAGLVVGVLVARRRT